jgi:hypothetical protein
MIQETRALLPERNTVLTQHPEWLRQADLVLTEDCQLDFSFLGEGAGYRNVFGYFSHPTGQPPASFAEAGTVYVVFPNCSLSGSGGAMAAGMTVRAPYTHAATETNSRGKEVVRSEGANYVFPAGTTVCMVVFPNRWSSGNCHPSREPYEFYTSNPALNPEPVESSRHHCITYRSRVDSGKVVVGFEDLRRYPYYRSDNDFNDLLLYATVDPPTALSPESVN